jgi:hypothetical protein
LAAPNGVSTAEPPYDVQVRYLPTGRTVAHAVGEVDTLRGRLDRTDVEGEKVYHCSILAADTRTIDPESLEGRGSLHESAAFSVRLEASLREDAPGRTLWMRVRHAAQDVSAPWGGSALLRIVVDEWLEFGDSQERPMTLYHNPVLCGADLHLPSQVRDRCTISLEGQSQEQSVPLLVDGRPQQTYVGTIVEVRGDTVHIPALGANAASVYRLGRVVMSVGRSPGSKSSSVRAPVLDWSSAGNLEPFLRFAEKTGWNRFWRGFTVAPSESWSLLERDAVIEAGRGGSQFLVLRGRGTWSLASEDRLLFDGPCLLGFVHVLPDSMEDHRERYFRWRRQWSSWHDSRAAPSNGGPATDPSPWFEAGFPLLDRTASAVVGEFGADVLECPYSEDLYRYFRETWIVDGLHEVTRWALGGWRKWDTMLGTLQSRGSHVFSPLDPGEVEARRQDSQRTPHWPVQFGEQVPIVIPVTSGKAAKEIWKHRDLKARSSKNVAAWTPTVSNESRTLQDQPAGWLIRQHCTPPGMMMVPTGFALILQNPADELDESTIIESAYRTPRLFGELEVDRDGMLPAVSSVLIFSESNERAATPEVAPLSLSLVFTVPHRELFQLMADETHGGSRLRLALNTRIREVARSGRRHALFFSKDALGSMREWLYHEWRRLGGPVGDLSSFPISKLLVAGILGHGTRFASLSVDLRWKAWNNKALRSTLVDEGIIERERRGGGLMEYTRVHFQPRPLGGEWEQRFRREGRDRAVPRRRLEAVDRPAGGADLDVSTRLLPVQDERSPTGGGSNQVKRDLGHLSLGPDLSSEGMGRTS